jgi:hypothetical protein
MIWGTSGLISSTVGHDVLGIIILMAFVVLHPPIEGKLPSAPVVKIWKADCVLVHCISIATIEYSLKVLIWKPISARVARIGSTISCRCIETRLMIILHINDPFVGSKIFIVPATRGRCVFEAYFVVQFHSFPFIKAKERE